MIKHDHICCCQRRSRKLDQAYRPKSVPSRPLRLNVCTKSQEGIGLHNQHRRIASVYSIDRVWSDTLLRLRQPSTRLAVLNER